MKGLYQAQGGAAGTKFAEERGPFFIGQKRMVEACLRQADKIDGRESHTIRVAILVAHGSFKHGRIVAGNSDGQTAAKQGRERMVAVSCSGAPQLAGQSAGAEVARGANFQRNSSRGNKIQGALVAHDCNAVADTLDAQHLDGFANRFWAPDFSRMNQAVHALAGHVIVNRAQIACRKTELIAADSISDNVRRV